MTASVVTGDGLGVELGLGELDGLGAVARSGGVPESGPLVEGAFARSTSPNCSVPPSREPSSRVATPQPLASTMNSVKRP
jgi:hypothetical protein